MTKLGVLITLLTGEALDWASPPLEQGDPILNDFAEFIHVFSFMFDDPPHAHSAEVACSHSNKARSLLQPVPLMSVTWLQTQPGMKLHRFTISI